MSYEVGIQTLRLEPTERLAHTEYCSNYALVRAVTGLDPKTDGSAWQAFYDAWELDLLWVTNDGPKSWGERGRVTDMGHAEFLEGGINRRDTVYCPFRDVEEVLSFDAVEEYGLPSEDELISYYEQVYQNSQRNHPKQIYTGGYYKTIVSGLIQTFGWDMLLEAAADRRRFDRVIESFFRLSLHHYRAWAKTSVEIFICHDDMVWTQGPFMHPDFYRASIFPRYRKLWEVLHEAGKTILYCSDGTLIHHLTTEPRFTFHVSRIIFSNLPKGGVFRMRIFDEKEIGYVREVLNSRRLGWYRAGMTGRFEQAFAEFVGSTHAITRSSAMTGLAQAVSCSEAGWDTEVICDPVVHFGGVSALYENATPVFADIERDTLLMDPDSVRKKITEKTKALIVTNLWGLCARLDELRGICDDHGIFMIEDCAHNMCSYWKGKHAGTWGHIGVFSFQQGKHLPTGDGGMMVTDDDELDHKLYNEWAFGGESPAFFTLNFRMNEVTAAIGLAQLERVRGYVETYNACLKHFNGAIEGCEWLRPRRIPDDAIQAGYNWCCFWEGDKHGLNHDRFKQVAREAGAPLGFGFTQKPAYLFDVFQSVTDHAHPARKPFKRHAPYPGKKYAQGDCPVAEDTIWRIVSSGAMLGTEEAGKRAAEKIHAAIEVMNKG